ncbi:MAG: histidine triad nucleotide-binding protein [Azoarcus sp.]|jgi:histidine triad (HIT) family protein|nr:histidine triad nucleotide-binding protein [Azoarcus sp.]MDD2872594.1 histidine triad nucleotide-binding protein [Azoarcus sp.]MDX9836434.1 histidine triad nucleotide-binding protein [Azoarcus sp.]
MTDCLFCRIVSGEIPARKVYEDDLVLAFHDIEPAAPVHILLIPKRHVASMADLEASHEVLMGHMMVVAARIAREQGCTDGFRTIVNTGRVGLQEVYHLHIHIVGGPQPLPPMLKY